MLFFYYPLKDYDLASETESELRSHFVSPLEDDEAGKEESFALSRSPRNSSDLKLSGQGRSSSCQYFKKTRPRPSNEESETRQAGRESAQ